MSEIETALVNIIKSSNLEELKKLIVGEGLQNISYLCAESVRSIIEDSNVNKLELLLDNGLQVSYLWTENLSEVIKHSDTKKLKLLLEKGLKLSNLYSESLAEVINSSDLDKLKLLLDNGLEPSKLYSESLVEVIKSIEDLEKLGLLLSKGLKVSYPLPEKLVSAIKSTNIEQLKHLLDNGLKFNEIFSYSIKGVLDAIRSSDTEKLKLLLDRGLINRLPIVDVLNHHDVDDLKLLFDHGLKIEDLHTEYSYLVEMFIKSSNSDKLKLFLDNGLKIPKLTSIDLIDIIKDNDIDKLKLLLDNGLKIPKLTSIYVIEIIKDSSIDKLKLLLDYSFKLEYLRSDKRTSELIKSISHDKLMFLLDNGFNEGQRYLNQHEILKKSVLPADVYVDSNSTHHSIIHSLISHTYGDAEYGSIYSTYRGFLQIDNYILNSVMHANSLNQDAGFHCILVGRPMKEYDPQTSDGTLGYYDFLNKKIVASKATFKLGTIVHEYAHRLMDIIFNNDSKPYFLCATDKTGCFQKQEYDKAKMSLLHNIGRDAYGITDFSAFNTSNSYSFGKELFKLPFNFYNPQKNSCSVGLDSFGSKIKSVYNQKHYIEEKEDCEIIVRLPQILSEIKRSQGLEEDILEPLESYWKNHIQPEVDKYIAKHDHSEYCDLL